MAIIKSPPLKIIFNALLVVLLIVFQTSFFNHLDYPLNNFNLVLSLLIFATVIINHRLGLILALIIGPAIDFYSGLTFGIITFSLLSVIATIGYLFDHFFTNRSVYSLLSLGIVANILYGFLLLTLSRLFYLIKVNEAVISLDKTYFMNLLWQIGLNLLTLLVIFTVTNFITKKLKPYFIIK